MPIDSKFFVKELIESKDPLNKRKGVICIYTELWHIDIKDLIERKINLFVYSNDLFYERLKEGLSWTLFCPSDVPLLINCKGEDFKKVYEEYEKKGLGRKTVNAMEFYLYLTSEKGAVFVTK
jgi:ribonucleotide reductase alpha subunit